MRHCMFVINDLFIYSIVKGIRYGKISVLIIIFYLTFYLTFFRFGIEFSLQVCQFHILR